MTSFRRSICALTLLLGWTGRLAAQGTGELRLEVRDPSGAAVAATGRLENLTTGLSQRYETNAQGNHTFDKLPFGRYRLSVTRAGFATHSMDVDVQSSATVDRTVVLAIVSSAYAVDVVAATPLAGVDRTLDEIAAPVRVANDRDIDASGALDLSDFLNKRLSGVFLNEVQGNPVQPDLNYRGYTASPLLGTPQGISVYMDGVRLNQPFGDVVSWDLIPRIAVAETTFLSGSNPLFGLNTLGGALSLQTKDGSSKPGTAIAVSGGSFGRKMAEMEHGGSASNGFNWYGATNLLFEDGWRQASPTNVRQFFGKLGWQGRKTVLGLTLAYANNHLTGNGVQEQRLLAADYSSFYTKPDITANRAPFTNLSLRHSFTDKLTFSGNAYYRYIRTNTLNADLNEGSLDQSMYQPGAAERTILAANGYPNVPAAGLTAANTPFPFLRCIGNALLRDEPGEKCNGLLNRTHSIQRNYGVMGQVNWFTAAGGHRNNFTAGAAFDGNNVHFNQSSELGYLNPDRSVTGIKAFGDGVTGGNVNGEPYDTRVNLRGKINTSSVYFTDTFSAGKWNLTFSGRYNHTDVDNTDRVRPTGTGTLTAQHTFDRFNPSVGVTFNPTAYWNTYFSYSEGNRAPTSIELGCADPNLPCKLPNAMAGDPPLKQVVTRTIEAGLRGGSETPLRWSIGYFRADNRNDILFVSSVQTGFGYFKNFGKTLRQGVELDLNHRFKRVTVGANYTFLDATFQSPEFVNGSGNSTNAEARAGRKGLESTIQVQPGNNIPLIPQHMTKVYVDIQATSKFLIDVNVLGVSSSYARGNENNLHQPDGSVYLGPGSSPGYGVVSLGARYQIHRRVELFVRVNNLFDRKYYTASQLRPAGITPQGTYIARPLAAINGEFPVLQSTFLAPGAPIGAWGGMRVRF